MPPRAASSLAAPSLSTPSRDEARRTLALRIAHRNRLRELRAERLARLRPGAPDSPAPEPEAAADASAPADAAAALEDFLRALAGSPAATEAEKPGALPPATVLPWPEPVAQPMAEPSAESVAASCDLGLLPGAGDGLVWALRRAGIARLADLAPLAPEALAARLGPIGRLVPAAAWIGRARAAADQDAVDQAAAG